MWIPQYYYRFRTFRVHATQRFNAAPMQLRSKMSCSQVILAVLPAFLVVGTAIHTLEEGAETTELAQLVAQIAELKQKTTQQEQEAFRVNSENARVREENTRVNKDFERVMQEVALLRGGAQGQQLRAAEERIRDLAQSCSPMPAIGVPLQQRFAGSQSELGDAEEAEEEEDEGGEGVGRRRSLLLLRLLLLLLLHQRRVRRREEEEERRRFRLHSHRRKLGRPHDCRHAQCWTASRKPFSALKATFLCPGWLTYWCIHICIIGIFNNYCPILRSCNVCCDCCTKRN